MAFQIYETGSLQVTTGSGVVMDPGGLFVASDWNGADNIHPLSSSDDIYRNNGPIGENYHGILDGVNDQIHISPMGNTDTIKYGFDVSNTGSDAGITYSWWMKTFATSDHWHGTFIGSSFGQFTYYHIGGVDGFMGTGGIIGREGGLSLSSAFDNDWHHFVFTYDSGSEKEYIYIDNKLQMTLDSTNTNIPPSADDSWITLTKINGAIDEFAFCHKFLKPTDFAPFGKPINLMKKKDELRLKAYVKFGDGIEQGSGSNCHSLINGGGTYSIESYWLELKNGAYIGSASADLLKNSGKVIDFNV